MRIGIIGKGRKPRHAAADSFKAIRSMPYELRLRNYERDKEALFFQIGEMTPAEVRNAQQALVRKWMV